MTTETKVSAAISYASKGWHIFPVTPYQKIPYGSLVLKGHLNATTSADQITEWWTEAPKANIGLNLEASGLVCIDVDSYKPDCGFDDFIKDKHLPKTLTQKSASGGTHYIFKSDAGDTYPGTLCKGVDIKYNGYILLSPSSFNGRQYEWQNDLEPAQAPTWLAKKLPKAAEPRAPVLQLYLAEQNRILEVIANEGWHNTLLRLVGSLVAKRSSDESIHRFTDELTLQGYTLEDTRAEVQRMIDGARAKGFGTVLAEESSAELIKSSRGDVINNHYNVYTTLRESAWGQVFAFNELTGTKMVLEKPPGERGNPSFFKQREIKDSDYSRVAKWCNKNGLPTVNKSVIIDCVQELCEENIISPVRHYLEGLRFDPAHHEPQLSHWMERYFGAKPGSPEERQYIKAVSRLSLVQAVARALDPGCKADSVPILEGGQGIGKSTAIRVLHGAEWFGDALPPMGNKDASGYLRGLWGIELAELSFQRKAEIEVQKAFISRREERFRPPYGREEIVYPRRCVFWGTTNRTDYIKDDTGNRRFLPIRTTKVDFEGLKASRDMFWAEAVYYYNQGEQYWLSEDLVVYANEQTNERIEEDPWVEVVQTMLRTSKEISLKDACKVCFQDLQDQHITTMMTRRMSHCLQMAGWRGLTALQANYWRPEVKSRFEYVKIENTTATQYKEYSLTGAVNFYESNVKIVKTKFAGTLAEDALNIVNSDFVIESSVFEDVRSDAFDSDFSSGEIVSTNFARVGGDGVDFSGSRVSLKNLKFYDISDKAVSVGEGSKVTGQLLDIVNVGTGVAVKDGSKSSLSNLSIIGTKLYPLMVYTKKPAYGSASLDVKNIHFEDAQDVGIVENGNRMTIDGVELKQRYLDTKQLYQTLMKKVPIAP